MPGPVVAIMQPTFLPWQGYLALFDAADVFVFLDHVQFRPRSWQSRNRLLVGGTPRWVTVPVRGEDGSSRAAINRMRPLLDEGSFRRKLVATLRHNYGASPHYPEAGDATEAWLARDWTTLADVNIGWVQEAAALFAFETETVRSSELGAQGKRSGLIADILRRLGASVYLSAAGSAEYMIEDGVFPVEDVEVRFQDYEPQPYAQAQADEFVPYLSTLDALLQIGATATRDVLRAGVRTWVLWDEMAARLARV
jgi:hypothetical protein